MVTRREFLKAVSLAGSGAWLAPRLVWGGVRDTGYFGLHEFIETHRDGVFVFRTSVQDMADGAAIRSAAYDLGRTLFVEKPGPANAFPTSTLVAIKPNLTCRGKWEARPQLPYSVAKTRGVQTDCNFVEGLINSVTEVGVGAGQIYVREANCWEDFAEGGYTAMAQRTGVHLDNLSAPVTRLDPAAVQWVDVPAGIWYKRIPYLWPVNTPGSCLINVAKLKSHSMGMTLCAKNLQGTNASPYVRHCRTLSDPLEVDSRDVYTGAADVISANHTRHRDAGVPRWNTPGESGGLWMETWATRCCDNHTVTHPAINIVEGVYGREGPFLVGPGEDGYGVDVLTNIVIFGINAFHVDLIGQYLSGHEPGNFGLMHIALERGLSSFLNPRSVPLYEWTSLGTASQISLDDVLRTPIRTPYLAQPGENTWHLVNEPYDYDTSSVVSRPAVPEVVVLSQNYPNPFNPSTSIGYSLPRTGPTRLEVLDVTGRIVDILIDGPMPAGDHLAVWRSGGRSSGTYFCRLLFAGLQRTKAMVLVK